MVIFAPVSIRLIISLVCSLSWAFGLWGRTLPTLSEHAKVSVMTCGAGDKLYYAFGHTAFRVQDPLRGLDLIYNYGTFDFDRPNFYLNFAKGKLIYTLSRRRFGDFLYTYEYEKRWVREQLLDLDQKQVNQLFAFLEDNYRPENREYLYDPLFNNCSNITATVLKEQFGNRIVFGDQHLEKRHTFREIVRQFISLNTWGSFGIELAFGGVTDRVATLEEHMFSPYYAMQQLRNTSLDGRPLIKKERLILDYKEMAQKTSFITSPLFWFVFLLLFVVIITFLDWRHGTCFRWLDFALFLISGLSGLVVLLLWLATDHVVTQLNFNFLWLLPTNAIVAFFVLQRKSKIPWLKTYLYAALVAMLLVLLIWVLGFQAFSPLNSLLMLLLSCRYLLLLKRH